MAARKVSHRYFIVKSDHESLYMSQGHVNTSNSQLKSPKTDVGGPRYAPRPPKAHQKLTSHCGTETPMCLTICLTGPEFLS